jgi:hypothetical protein
MDTSYRDDVKNALDRLLLDMPGVKPGKTFGFHCYKVDKKVFASVGGKGIGLKLPETRVKEIIASHPAAKAFQPVEGLVWNGWVTIIHENADDYRNDIALFEEAIEFVAG